MTPCLPAPITKTILSRYRAWIDRFKEEDLNMKKNKYGVFPIIGIVFGAIVIILGITLLGKGDTAGHASFGADFYTYSYRASRYAANNLAVLIQAMAYLLIAFGLFDIAFFGCKLVAGMPPKPRMAAPVYNGAMPNNANPGYQAPQPANGYGAQPRPVTPPYGNTYNAANANPAYQQAPHTGNVYAQPQNPADRPQQ